MESVIINFIVAHHQWAEGVVVGAIVSHPAALALGFFNLLVKIPGVGPWIAAHPDQAKGFADGFDKAIDQAIDRYSAKPQESPKP